MEKLNMGNKKEKVCVLSKMKELYPDDFTIEWDNPNDTSPLLDDDNYKRMRQMEIDFTLYLIEKKYLIELPNDEPEKDCVILYFNDDNELQYAGIVEEANGHDSIVRSRWGNFSAVIKHKLGYVPRAYGTKVKFYKPLTTEQTEDYLSEYLMKNPHCFKYGEA